MVREDKNSQSSPGVALSFGGNKLKKIQFDRVNIRSPTKTGKMSTDSLTQHELIKVEKTQKVKIGGAETFKQGKSSVFDNEVYNRKKSISPRHASPPPDKPISPLKKAALDAEKEVKRLQCTNARSIGIYSSYAP